VAKDTEKLIRQLSLIAYLMAERRPVTATEIRRDVEGYSDMTEDAFARRFYADRAELDALGIHLSVDKPAEGFSEQENYSLAPESFFLPSIAFSDEELGALQTALSLLDGEFAYAEPLRLALQQVTWGRPSSLASGAQRSIKLNITASAGGAELSARLAKIDTAIYRRKRIEFEYYTMQSGQTELRRVDPYHLLYEAGQFYLVGHSHERDGIRMFRLSRIRGKVSYATKAEHDFQRPADFDPREYANRVPWQLGDTVGTAEIRVAQRIAWWVERNFGAYGTLDEDGVYRTDYAIARLLLGWVLYLGEDAQLSGPPELASELGQRLDRIIELHSGAPQATVPAGALPIAQAPEEEEPASRSRGDAVIRPERFARLVTLASHLIAAGRAGERLAVQAVCEQLKMSTSELREDIAVLNVVNFGGGAYVLYAEILPSGEIEVDPEPYSDTFDRPARLLPIEAKALIAAIDLIGPHLSPALESAQRKIEQALGEDASREGLLVTHGVDDPDLARRINGAIHGRRLLHVGYFAQAEGEISERVVEPYALINGLEGWYAVVYDPAKGSDDDPVAGVRHFRLDRMKDVRVLDGSFERRPEVEDVAEMEGWPTTGVVEDSQVAHVWISPDQARWAREARTVIAELEDGAIIVELPFKGTRFLVKEVLKEAGDAAVLSPPDARAAVLDAAQALASASAFARVA
jgi:proteasome accessory factor C